MKKALILLLLIGLLCGCDAGERGITNVPSLPPPSETTLPPGFGLYESESQTAGAVKAFRLPAEDVYGLRAMEEGLILFSGTEQTTLTLLRGSDLRQEAAVTLGFRLSHTDPSLQIQQECLSWFDPVACETVVTDARFREVRRIPAPDKITCAPILSRDQDTLFYCTDSGIFAWDLDSGLHRMLRQTNRQELQLIGLLKNGSILHCTATADSQTEALFLSTETGRALYTHAGAITVAGSDAHFYASYPSGIARDLVYGAYGDHPCSLSPRDMDADCIFLTALHGAVTVSTPADETITLDYYDLESGLRSGSVTLPEAQEPLAIIDGCAGFVYLLSQDSQDTPPVLYRWDPDMQTLRDPVVYTGVHYTANAPDLEGLGRCRSYAAVLSEKHGVNILIWKDATAVQPWDYDLEAEYLVQVLQRQLEELDRCLSQYPEEILSQTAAHFSSLNFCLVRQIQGTAESGSLDTASGIQFMSGSDAYVVLAADGFSERTLYHELYHVMETHILGNSIAYDQWGKLNPAGFSYDYSYISNKTRDSGVYLQHNTRAFVDTYSMSYPKEDRARILEYAMMPGNRELFQAETLQRKLRTVCQGIREAYGLESYQGTLLWEQYLD